MYWNVHFDHYQCRSEYLSWSRYISTRMVFLLNLFKFCGYLVCFLGCSYQIWTVVSHYLLYETIMESLMFRPKFFVAPDVSICFPFIQILNYSLAFTQLPGLKDALLQELGPHFDSNISESLEKAVKKNDSLLSFFYDNLLGHHSIRDIMNVTNELDSMLISCVSLVPGQYSLGPCVNTSQFNTFVKDDLKCFQFKSHGDRYKYDLEQLYTWQYPYVYMFRIKFANIDPLIERMVMYIHPRNRWPAARTDIPLIIFFPVQKSGYSIAFSRSYIQLLPAPYQTNCRNYRHSRNQEIDQCAVEVYENWNGVAPPWLTLPTNSSFRTFRRTIMTLEEFTPFNNVALDCFSKILQPDCVTEEFKPQLTGSARTNSSDGSFRIDISLPTSLDVENYMRPARTKIDLFIYIVSLLGFWFGIHIATLFRVHKKVKKVKKFHSTLRKSMSIQSESNEP